MTTRPSNYYQALEPTRGETYRAQAETFFVRAIVTHLLTDAADARVELEATPNDGAAVRTWARRWHVDCRCVIAWARANVIARSILGPGGRAGALVFGYDRPAAWLKTLHDLNGGLLDARGVDLRDLARPRDARPERSTSPLAADPLLESHATFMRRAEGHWDARAELARQRGFTPIATSPDLELHCEWLARYELRQELIPAIAQTPGQQATVANIQQQIRRLRKVLGLKSSRRRGRPRK